MDTDNIAVNVGALSNATRPMFHAPSPGNGGGLTVVSADVAMAGTTAASLELVKGVTSGGTLTINGTIAAAIGGTASLWVANVVKSFTPSGTAVFVQANEWVAVKEKNVQACDAVTLVSVGYQDGR